MPIKVFFVVPTGTILYTQSFECKSCGHYTRVEKGEIVGKELPDLGDWDAITHPCEKCGKPVRLSSTGGSPFYSRQDTGEVLGGKDKLPPGACYDADWCHDVPEMCGPDGRSLVVVLPTGHHWHVDTRASNCTMPTDNVHKCWVRHGRPEDGTLHVDKNGNTCAAGAGSILVPGYHGFLHGGFLTDNM